MMESTAHLPRLYTARYANKTRAKHPAAKVRMRPCFRLSYHLAGKISELAPTRAMFGTTPAEFTARYTTLLVERGGVELLTQRFADVAAEAGSDGLVLLCFEDLRKPGAFCHRRVFADWWTAATKQLLLELPESGASDV